MAMFPSRHCARAFTALLVALTLTHPEVAPARAAQTRSGSRLLYRASADSARISGACAGERFAVLFLARGRARALDLSDPTGATGFALADVEGEAVGACRDSFLAGFRSKSWAC